MACPEHSVIVLSCLEQGLELMLNTVLGAKNHQPLSSVYPARALRVTSLVCYAPFFAFGYVLE